MWFLLEQCKTKIRAQTFNQSNIVDIGKVLFADSLVYKYSSIKTCFGILDLILPSNSGLSEWNQFETIDFETIDLINQASSLITLLTRPFQIKLSVVI